MIRFLIRYILRRDRVLAELREECETLKTRLAHAQAEIGHWEDRCGGLNAEIENLCESLPGGGRIELSGLPKFPVSMPE